MFNIRKFLFRIKKRRRKPDEWDKTIIAFSPYWLKDLALPEPQDVANPRDDKVEQQVFKVRLANNEDRRKSASLLIQKMHDWRGYDTDALSHDPNKITLAAYQDDSPKCSRACHHRPDGVRIAGAWLVDAGPPLNQIKTRLESKSHPALGSAKGFLLCAPRRAIADSIADMNDRYAIREYRRRFAIEPGSLGPMKERHPWMPFFFHAICCWRALPS